ncbi:hypothetical protein WICANDRAFT_77283 [Wickerhamomyces anomalus NRRL Y-366-8]|uniref:Alpha/beta hydrolase fold-3 domain-containing protein n=1 Tax=Wickerhamomyces anomalus (strain ATCC 58044 / CBS 1984 / NCYC 433 / NRRL Y-366-8) TaxID=683960 RepID=A0A1E3P5E7_WICAA|nr:uncharacterized protein WICANDRAFT_77283 [Wickerhamomyces anomalus NRRL Y-366-8]ODQ60603.1 hypothetical protein WICANDRAFT_77283 [Wickerhamomyces anomalus NRRL Y-366-8]
MFTLNYWIQYYTTLPFTLLYNFVVRNKTFNYGLNKLRWIAKTGSYLDVRQNLNEKELKDILALLKKNEFPEISNEEYTSKARWIIKSKNLTKDSPILFFIHGGGFTLKAQKSQIRSTIKTYRALHNEDLSILLIDYQVAPESRFPTPIEEVFYVYHKLTEQDGYKNIIIMGDSAGANLASLVLYQVQNKLENFLKLKVKPNAAVLLSPWVDLAAEKKGSFIKNEQFDYISYEAVRYWGSLYTSEPENPLASPLKLAKWEGALPNKVFYQYGDGEVLLDMIEAFKDKIGVQSKDVHIEPNGTHIHQFVNYSKYSQEKFETTPFCNNLVAFLKTVV